MGHQFPKTGTQNVTLTAVTWNKLICPSGPGGSHSASGTTSFTTIYHSAKDV